MPPHCDSMDGPVVKAAREALSKADVDVILPFAPKDGESEVTKAFDKAMAARKCGADAQEVADLYFFETVVRIHRAGEGAPYTGLKPAGLGHGPVVPVAEKAIETGSVDELVRVLADKVAEEVRGRFEHVMHLKGRTDGGVDEMREYVEAMLGLQIWSHKLYQAAAADSHAHESHRHE